MVDDFLWYMQVPGDPTETGTVETSHQDESQGTGTGCYLVLCDTACATGKIKRELTVGHIHHLFFLIFDC